jgi:hypothetical protein
VSTSSVSAIVGYTVPSPVLNSTSFVVSKALNLTSTVTDCTYEVMPGLASPTSSKSIVLSYQVFNKRVTVAELEEAATAEEEAHAAQEKAMHFKVSYSSYPGLGVTAVYYKLQMSMGGISLPAGVTLPKGISLGITYQGIATLSGNKSYAADVNNDTLSQSSLASLVRLAMKL